MEKTDIVAELRKRLEEVGIAKIKTLGIYPFNTDVDSVKLGKLQVIDNELHWISELLNKIDNEQE